MADRSESCGKEQADRRRFQPPTIFEVLVPLIIVGTIVFYLLGGHFFHREYQEVARQAVCLHNLHTIGIRVEDQGISFDADHVDEIEAIIAEADLYCATAYMTHEDIDRARYHVEMIGDGGILVTEGRSNHDTSTMAFTDMPTIRCVLRLESDRFVVERDPVGQSDED